MSSKNITFLLEKGGKMKNALKKPILLEESEKLKNVLKKRYSPSKEKSEKLKNILKKRLYTQKTAFWWFMVALEKLQYVPVYFKVLTVIFAATP